MIDLSQATGADIIYNIEDISLSDERFYYNIGVDTLEDVSGLANVLSKECRLFKPYAISFFSVPFLVGFYADPNDFLRWTRTVLIQLIENYGTSLKDVQCIGCDLDVVIDFISAHCYKHEKLFDWISPKLYSDNPKTHGFFLVRKNISEI